MSCSGSCRQRVQVGWKVPVSMGKSISLRRSWLDRRGRQSRTSWEPGWWNRGKRRQGESRLRSHRPRRLRWLMSCWSCRHSSSHRRGSGTAACGPAPVFAVPPLFVVPPLAVVPLLPIAPPLAIMPALPVVPPLAVASLLVVAPLPCARAAVARRTAASDGAAVCGRAAACDHAAGLGRTPARRRPATSGCAAACPRDRIRAVSGHRSPSVHDPASRASRRGPAARTSHHR